MLLSQDIELEMFRRLGYSGWLVNKYLLNAICASGSVPVVLNSGERSITSSSQLGMICTHEDVWQCLETF